MEEKRIFISGKITGENIAQCFDKFYKAYHKLSDMTNNISCINPLFLEGIHFGISHEKAMELCFTELKNCTHIYMLKDWKKSKGAIMEHQFALDNNIKIIYQE